MENARILIYGTGTVGIYFGGTLAKAGLAVTFADLPERAEALNQSGIAVKGIDSSFSLKPEVYSDLSDLEPQDFVLVCVKAIHTYDVAINLLPVLKPSTAVLSFQNGLENENILSELLGRNLVVGTVLQFHGRLEEGFCSVQDSPAQVIFGELDHQPSEREEWLSKIFSKADIGHVISHNINQKIWEHFIWNSAFNSVAALTNSSVQEILEHQAAFFTIEQLSLEMVRVAASEGVNVNWSSLEELNRTQIKYTHVKPAMLQDIEAGRRPELEPMLGILIKKGKKYDISTPVCTTIYNLLQLYCTHSELEVVE